MKTCERTDEQTPSSRALGRLRTDFRQRAEQDPQGDGVDIRHVVEVELRHMEPLRLGLVVNIGLFFAVILVNNEAQD